jgi:exonuclease III
MHVPNRVSGRKWPFLDAVLGIAESWRRGPALLLGDTNSGRRGIDEESRAFNAREEAWIDGLERAGWRDAFRHLRGAERAYTWYSPNGGNGFRIDQAFVNAGLLPSLSATRHDWGRRGAIAGRRAGLSDHAALLLDIGDASRGGDSLSDTPPAAGPPGGARQMLPARQRPSAV